MFVCFYVCLFVRLLVSLFVCVRVVGMFWTSVTYVSTHTAIMEHARPCTGQAAAPRYEEMPFKVCFLSLLFF